MSNSENSPDDLWKQYDVHVDLYKHYLKLVIEMNVFYYAITGAIVSYYFAHRIEEPEIRFSLMLPIAMSAFLAFFFLYGIIKNHESRKEMYRIGAALKLKVVPEFGVLSGLLGIFAILMISVAIGLGALLFKCG